MRVVTIPKDRDPFIIRLNNTDYFYKAGETIEVPDEVADIVERYEAAKVSGELKLEWVEGLKYNPVKDAGKKLTVKDDGSGLAWV